MENSPNSSSPEEAAKNSSKSPKIEIDPKLVKKLPERDNEELNQRLYKATKLLNNQEFSAALIAIYPAILSKPRNETLIEFLDTIQDANPQFSAVEKYLVDAAYDLGSQPLKARKLYEKARVIKPSGNLLQEALLRTYPPNLSEKQKIEILQKIIIDKPKKTSSNQEFLKSFSPEHAAILEKVTAQISEEKYSEALRTLFPLYLSISKEPKLAPFVKTISKQSNSLHRADQLFLETMDVVNNSPEQAIQKLSQVLEIEAGNLMAIKGIQFLTNAMKPASKPPSSSSGLAEQRILLTFTSEKKREQIRLKRKYEEPKKKKEEPKGPQPKYVKLSAQQRAEAHIKVLKKDRAKVIIYQLKHTPIWLFSMFAHVIFLSMLFFFLYFLQAANPRYQPLKIGTYIHPIEIEKEEIKEKEEEKEEVKEEKDIFTEEEEDRGAPLGVPSDPNKAFRKYGSGGGWRKGNSKKGALDEFGGSASSEEAVTLGLEWLERHQHPDGSWRALEFTHNCREGSRCQGTAIDIEYRDGDYDTGYTALSMLCFLGAGYNHKEKSEKGYEVVLQKAINYLIKNQLGEGYYGPLRRHEMSKSKRSCNMYVHGVASLAMSEAYWLTKDPNLRKSLEKAIKFINETQQESGGWDYYAHQTGRSDTSISGWIVMALKSAKAAGFDIDEKMWKGAKKYFEFADLGNGKFRYANQGPPSFSTTRRGAGMAAVGILCRIYLGASRDSSSLKRAAAYLLKNPPNFSELRDYNFKVGTTGEEYLNNNMYYWYYATLALFQMGGERWNTWNGYLRDMLVTNQVKEGCSRGSWDPVGQWLSPVGGRLYSTTLNILNLEIYYRYLPIYKLQEEGTNQLDSPAHYAKWRRSLKDKSIKAKEHLETIRLMTQSQVPDTLDFTTRKLCEMLQNTKREIRWSAFKMLTELGQEACIPDLIKLYFDEGPAIQSLIIKEIAQYGSLYTIPFFIEQMIKGKDNKVVTASHEALMKITGQKFGKDGKKWKKYWEENPPSLKVQCDMLKQQMDRVVTDIGFEKVEKLSKQFLLENPGTVFSKEISLKYPLFYSKWAELLLTEGRLNRAVVFYRKMLKAYPKSNLVKRWKKIIKSVDFFQKGVTEFEKKNYSKASELIDESVYLNRSFALGNDYRLAISLVLKASGRYFKEAKQFWKAKDYEKTIEYCKKALEEKKDHKEARELLTKAERIFFSPKRINGIIAKAQNAQREGDFEKAIDFYRELSKLQNFEAKWPQKMRDCELQMLQAQLRTAIKNVEEDEAGRIAKKLAFRFPEDTQSQQMVKKFLYGLRRGEEILIPGGEFCFNTNNPEAPSDEKPAKFKSLPAFYADKYEVTRGQYYRFCQRERVKRYPKGWRNGKYPPGTEKMPVTNISYDEASRYAEWAGKRLPTEEEWQKIARGFRDTKYPWGDFWDAERGNFSKDLHNVGSFSGDSSVYGIQDLGGNVAEWTLITSKKGKDLQAVIKGGAYIDKNPAKTASTTARFIKPRTESYSFVGFRCVRDATGN